jgi:hypothetical protein
MGTHAGRIDTDDPLQLPDRFGLGLRMGQQQIPGAVAAPAHKPVMPGLPRSVPLGQVPPGRAGAQLPEDAVDHPAMVTPLAAAPPVGGQQRLKLGPCPIGELPAPNHPHLHQLKPVQDQWKLQMRSAGHALVRAAMGGYGWAVGSGRAVAPVPAVGAGRRGSLTPAGGGPPVPGRGVDRWRLCSSRRHLPVQPPTAPGRGAGSVTWRMLSS